MSDTQEPGALAAGLEAQRVQLWLIIERLEHGRRAVAPGSTDLSWKGPAHAAYLAARLMFNHEMTTAIDALRAARDFTATALDTLANRG